MRNPVAFGPGLPEGLWSPLTAVRLISMLSPFFCMTSYGGFTLIRHFGLGALLFALGSTAALAQTQVWVSATVTNGDIDTSNDGDARPEADALCAGDANAPAGFTNSAALLSIAPGDTISDLPTNNPTYPAADPVQNIMGQPIADNFADLISGMSLDNPIQSPSVIVWTGSTSVGGLNTNHCANWTSNMAGTGRRGNSVQVVPRWIDDLIDDSCGLSRSLYCISWNAPVPPPPPAGSVGGPVLGPVGLGIMSLLIGVLGLGASRRSR